VIECGKGEWALCVCLICRFAAAERSILKMIEQLHQPPLERTDIVSTSIDRVKAAIQDFQSHSSPSAPTAPPAGFSCTLRRICSVCLAVVIERLSAIAKCCA
jgi:hypothetical protein